MFPKREAAFQYDVIIGTNTIIKGDIESEGSIRVDGRVIGNLTCLGNVIISEGAYIQGDMTCHSAEIHGYCEGNLKLQGRTTLYEKATLIGDISCKGMHTSEGATFKGACVVSPDTTEEITLDPQLHKPLPESNLVTFEKRPHKESEAPAQGTGKTDTRGDARTDAKIDPKRESKEA